jgi:putative hydrolase of the HAD superfamily
MTGWDLRSSVKKSNLSWQSVSRRAIRKKQMKYKAVVFDLFGTLVDGFSREGYYSAISEMISILKAPKDEFLKLWQATSDRRVTGGFPSLVANLEYICGELKVPVTKTQLNLARWVRYDYVALALAPRPHAIETLSRLRTDGLKIGLVSNCSTEPPIIWPHTPFAPFFDVTVFSSVAGLQKPDPKIYLMATEKLGVQPQDCLYVGDGDSNELTGAAGVGMHPVLIRVAQEDSAEPVRINPEIDNYECPCIASLQEVLNLVGEQDEI